jgi:hypothetical protein
MDRRHKDTIDGLENIVRDMDAWADRNGVDGTPVRQAELEFRAEVRAKLRETIRLIRSWEDVPAEGG